MPNTQPIDATEPERLNVYPNPWCALDGDGNPVGAIPLDCDHHLDINEFVGANRTAKVLRQEVTKKLRGRFSQKEIEITVKTGRQVNSFSYQGATAQDLKDSPERLFAGKPTRLPYTTYYRKRILRCELLAADAATARLANVPFIEPAYLVELQRAGLRTLDLAGIARVEALVKGHVLALVKAGQLNPTLKVVADELEAKRRTESTKAPTPTPAAAGATTKAPKGAGRSDD